MSQSIKSSLISESTIARMAGNILSGYRETDPEKRRRDVQRAVALAREVAAEVYRTSLTICEEV